MRFRKSIGGLFVLVASAAFAQEPPADARDDVNTTMRTIADPNADAPDDVVRKIPAPKPKRAKKSADSTAKDLASPGKNDADEAGTPEPCEAGCTPEGPGTSGGPDTPSDPETPEGPGTADPGVPSDPIAPAPDTGPGNSGGHGNGHGGGAGPDPRDRAGGLGNQVSDEARNRGEEARRHHDESPNSKPPKDKPPRDPGSKPPRQPDPPGPGPKNPRPKPPDVRPHPPAPHPPGKPPRAPRPPGPG